VATARGSEDARIEFALDGFDAADGRLVVSGRWYGVTGRRFVRPVLEVDGKRRVIAVLDHKPWPAVEGAAWLAAFPHDGPAGPSRLQVAPDIAVELPPAGPEAGDGRPRPARVVRATPKPRAKAKPAGRKTEERDPGDAELEAVRREKDDARAETERLRSELDQSRREVERLSEELGHARTDTDRLRTELSHVRAEANTLKSGQDQTQARAQSVEADVARLRADAQRARAERDAAKAELERGRPLPPSSPYIAPRPMAFNDRRSGPSWQLRALAAFGVVAVFLVLLQVLFGLF
jgi:archaellum component FlaC